MKCSFYEILFLQLDKFYSLNSNVCMTKNIATKTNIDTFSTQQHVWWKDPKLNSNQQKPYQQRIPKLHTPPLHSITFLANANTSEPRTCPKIQLKRVKLQCRRRAGFETIIQNEKIEVYQNCIHNWAALNRSGRSAGYRPTSLQFSKKSSESANSGESRKKYISNLSKIIRNFLLDGHSYSSKIASDFVADEADTIWNRIVSVLDYRICYFDTRHLQFVEY